MCNHDDFATGIADLLDNIFNGSRCSRIQMRSRFIQEQHLGAQGPCSRQYQALLLTTGQYTRLSMRNSS